MTDGEGRDVESVDVEVVVPKIEGIDIIDEEEEGSGRWNSIGVEISTTYYSTRSVSLT